LTTNLSLSSAAQPREVQRLDAADASGALRDMVEGNDDDGSGIMDNIVIGCNDTWRTWYLTCRYNHWDGDLGNCTSRGSGEPKLYVLYATQGKGNVILSTWICWDNLFSHFTTIFRINMIIFLTAWRGRYSIASRYFISFLKKKFVPQFFFRSA